MKSMTLKDYKKNTGKTYRELAKQVGVDHNVIHRICTLPGYCPRLDAAHKIVSLTKGVVGYEDLLGSC